MIADDVYRWDYVGSGTNDTFPYDRKIFAESDLKVYVGGVLQTDHYAVTGVGENGGGNVIFEADYIPILDATVVIIRDVPYTQPADWTENDFNPAQRFEDSVDRLTVLLNQIARAITEDETTTHHTYHEDAGADEINLAGLSGVPAEIGPKLFGYGIDEFDNLADAINTIGSESTLLTIDKPIMLTASATIPSTLTLKILQGGAIIKASTYTLTINGPFEAGNYQVFIGFAAGDITFGLGSIDEVYPQWFGAVPGGTNCQSAYDQAVSAAPIGSTVCISPGIWYISTSWVWNKLINLKGYGTRSVLWISGLSGSNAITVGPANTTYLYSLHWKDFAILGGTSCCQRGLVLRRVINSRFENIHVFLGAAVCAVKAEWAICNYYNFIVSGNGISTYPEVPSTPAAGFHHCAANGDAEISNANKIDCIIEACAGVGLYIRSSAGGNDIRGIYEGNTGHGIYILGGDRCHLHDVYLESALSEAGHNKLVIEDHSWPHIGMNVLSATPASTGDDVEFKNVDEAIINGLVAARVLIDSNCNRTNIQDMKLVAAAGTPGLTDNGTATQWHPIYTGSGTYDPGSIAAAGYSFNSFTCTGAEFGMTAGFAAPYNTANLMITAYVSAQNEVSIVLYNPTAGAIDLASGTWRVWAMRVCN